MCNVLYIVPPGKKNGLDENKINEIKGIYFLSVNKQLSTTQNNTDETQMFNSLIVSFMKLKNTAHPLDVEFTSRINLTN